MFSGNKNVLSGSINWALRADVSYWVSHEHQLMLLKIPKNASSYFRTLFLANSSVAPDYNPARETPREYKQRTGRNVLSKKRRIAGYASYTKVAALRDPIARMVSCYLDRIVKRTANRHPIRLGHNFYAEVSRRTGKAVDEQSLTFEDYLDYVLACPDYRRDAHTRSQQSFIGRKSFDYYGTVDNMSDLLTVFRQKGMKTHGLSSLKPKQTQYGRPGQHPIEQPSQAPVQLLNHYSRFPAAADFFNERLLHRFIAKYEKDLALYCRVRGIHADDVIAEYV